MWTRRGWQGEGEEGMARVRRGGHVDEERMARGG